MVLNFFNKVLCEKHNKNIKKKIINIDKSVLNKYLLDCDFVKLKSHSFK